MSGTIDTIVIGGSAGSLEEIRMLLSRLPADIPATVLICKHYPTGVTTGLTELLARKSNLTVLDAEDGLRLTLGTAIVASPDTHMMLGEDHIHLRRGAHENNFRPAIDPLFRSAAVYRGPRAIGVILSGLLDDGTAGAGALVRTGGRVLVRSPGQADFPDMPQSVLDTVAGAEALDLPTIAARLIELCGRPAPAPQQIPTDIGIELKIAGLEGATMENEARLGSLSPYNCPHCNGVLWELSDGPTVRFRCHTGHAYTLRSLNEAQEEALDKGLFDALRAHKGRASLVDRLAEQAADGASRSMLKARVRKIEEDAMQLEDIIKSRRRT